MKRSSFFLGAITIAAAILLMIYGVSAIAPLLRKSAIETEETKPPAPTVPKVDFGNPSKGPVDAELTIVVFGDYQCESCATYDSVLYDVLAGFEGRVRLVWKDLPIVRMHPLAKSAAMAARCAQEQGDFWRYHDLLMANRDALDASNLPLFAQELGLNSEAFASCLNDKRTEPLVDRDVAEAIELGVTSAPYTFVGDQRFAGALSADRLRTVISSKLNVPIGD